MKTAREVTDSIMEGWASGNVDKYRRLVDRIDAAITERDVEHDTRVTREMVAAKAVIKRRTRERDRLRSALKEATEALDDISSHGNVMASRIADRALTAIQKELHGERDPR